MKCAVHFSNFSFEELAQKEKCPPFSKVHGQTSLDSFNLLIRSRPNLQFRNVRFFSMTFFLLFFKGLQRVFYINSYLHIHTVPLSYFVCGSWHFSRMTNLMSNFECLFWFFFQPTLKSDLKEVQFTQNYHFWVKAPW